MEKWKYGIPVIVMGQRRPLFQRRRKLESGRDLRPNEPQRIRREEPSSQRRIIVLEENKKNACFAVRVFRREREREKKIPNE
jgi:hypothetical protein